MAHDAISAHARDELGISDASHARPIQAALASAGSFAVGAGVIVGALRVTFWGALAMAVTAGVGSLFGTCA
jgi:vacuolar iron transporter family protein